MKREDLNKSFKSLLKCIILIKLYVLSCMLMAVYMVTPSERRWWCVSWLRRTALRWCHHIHSYQQATQHIRGLEL